MLNIIITFDYEIFFGKNNRSIDSILFDSTDRIMDALDAANVKGTFFVDTLSYRKFKEMNINSYCNKFFNQCVSMFKRGHDAQLHIHAHWISTEYEYNTGVWKNDFKKYRLQEYPKEIIEKAIDDGVDFLQSCAKITNDNYKCIAFRAGGLTLQPEKELIDILIKKGFQYDSSIARYTTSNIEYADYNYKKVPNKLNWNISPKLGLNIDANGEEKVLLEIPIATVKNNIIRIAKLKRPVRIANSDPGGEGFIRQAKRSSLFRKITNKIGGYHWVSLDTRSASLILSDINSIYKKYSCDKNDYTIALIGHPKMFNDINVNNLVQLIKEVKKLEGQYRFTTFGTI